MLKGAVLKQPMLKGSELKCVKTAYVKRHCVKTL